MTLPKPGIGMNPRPGEDQLVNIPGGSWLWIEEAAWHPVIAVASYPVEDPIETVVVTATPVTMVAWDLEDGPVGGHVVCNGPGAPYNRNRPPDAQSTDCSYTFRHAAEAATVTATVTWQITWSATGVIVDGGVLPDQHTTDNVTVHVVGAETVSAAA